VSAYARELYKTVRNNNKKLGDIEKIIERLNQKLPITEEQEEKFKNKQNFLLSV